MVVQMRSVVISVIAYIILRLPQQFVAGSQDSKANVQKQYEESGNRFYLNQFAIEIDNGPDADERARTIADNYGYTLKRKIGNLDGHYLLEHAKVQPGDYSHFHHVQLKGHPEVLWTEQQHAKRRSKRDNGATHFRYSNEIPDPLYREQWYLNHGGRGGFDMNVAGAWARGYTGKGIVVTILDDGIQRNHPDLIDNYDPLASYDINDNDPDPMPQDNGDNKHGTRCAGEVAAMAYNEFCGTGIAFNASIGGVRMLDGTVTDEVEARALSLNPQHVHIYSASWGPEDDGKTVDGPGRLAQRAFIDGILKGRRGLGSIFVWASGNGGRKSDSCNADGYTNSIYTLSISSATQHGSKPWYLEECSSTLATTYSSGSPGTDLNIVTVDMDTSYFRSIANGQPPIASQLCTLSHTGTSASAPIAAAIVALALEANPGLTWRDVQHLVVATSRYEPLRYEPGWVTNAVGRQVSLKFGYGLMDAEAMVRMAERWQTAPPQRICETSPNNIIHDIPGDNTQQLVVSLTTNACQGSTSEIHYLEHVQARLSLKFKPRGNLKITIISPSGTPSVLLLPRPRDTEESSFNNWPFLTTHFWGEPAQGTWQLFVKNDGSRSARWPGKLLSWSMVFYGTSEMPQSLELSQNSSFHYLPRRTSAKQSIATSDCVGQSMFQDENNKCVEKCPTGFYGDIESGHCIRCHDSCARCFGPMSWHCLTCGEDKFYFGDRCISTCPDTHYGDAGLRECLPCSSNCFKCADNPEKCTKCRPKLVLDVSSNRCVPSTFRCFGSDATNCTLPCQSPCLSCFSSSKRGCLSCVNGYRLIGTECIKDACPGGYFETESDLAERECRRCHSSCKTCTGPSHSNCLECTEGHRFVDGLCQRCQEGQFFAPATKTCEACHSSCLRCSGPTASDCLSCEGPLFLDRSRCVPCCSSAELTNEQAAAESLSSINDIRVSKSLAQNEGNCCKCYKSEGPCISQEHTRSILVPFVESVDHEGSGGDWYSTLLNRPKSVIASLGILAAVIFIVVFSMLHITNRRKPRGARFYRDYQIVAREAPGHHYDTRFERISLTSANEDEEEFSLFEKT